MTWKSISTAAGMFNLGRGDGCLQIVGQRDYGKEDEEDNRQRNQLCFEADCMLIAIKLHAAQQPENGKGNRERYPDKIEKYLHLFGL